jgi:hypothetical protein
VVSAVADLVDALTARLPRLRVLATSREPLWVDGEVSYRLSPLPVARPDASFEEVAAHDTDDWLAAARSIDVGIALLADASQPPPILGMLMCLRGECDAFNGDAKSAVASF